MRVHSILQHACRQAAEKHQAIMACGSSLCVCHNYITDQTDRQSTAHSGSVRTLRIASCILWKWVALWKWLAIILASSVDSTFAKVNRIRHPIACASQANQGEYAPHTAAGAHAEHHGVGNSRSLFHFAAFETPALVRISCDWY